MPHLEKEIQKRYWSISEICEQLKVATSVIRFYEDEFRLPVKRNQHGVRFYSPVEIAYLEALLRLGKLFKLDYLKQLHKRGKLSEALQKVEELEKIPDVARKFDSL